MYRPLHNGSGNQSSWHKNAEKSNSSFGLRECDCMRLHFGHHLGWFKKLAGVTITIASLAVFAWNETVAVDSSRSYHEGVHTIRILKNADDFRREHDGKLVHVTGYIDVHEPLEDPAYGISIRAVKLKRRVQMYQWVEGRDLDLEVEDAAGPDMESSLKYTMIWKDKVIDSGNFFHREHENPTKLPMHSYVRTSTQVHLGAFRLGPELREKFNNFKQFTGGERPDQPELKMHMGLYYHSNDLWNPSIGDVRVQFSFAGHAETKVSIVARQVGNELRSYTDQTGKEISYIYDGKKNHKEIFDLEHSATKWSVWIFRGCAWIFTIFGISMASGAITLMNRRNVVVQNWLLMGPTKFNFVSASFLCLSILGAVWFQHKPLFSALVIVFSCAMLIYYSLIGPAERQEAFRYNYLRSKESYLPRYLS